MDPMRNTKHDGPAGNCVILSFQVFFFSRLFTSKKRAKTPGNSQLKVFRWAPPTDPEKSRVITPISITKTPVTQLFSAIYGCYNIHNPICNQ